MYTYVFPTYVFPQIASIGGCIVTLITFVWRFSTVQLQSGSNNPKSFDQSATTGVHLQFNLELIAESFTN